METNYWQQQYSRLLDELLVFYGMLGTLRGYDGFEEGISEKQLKEIIKTVDTRLQKLREDEDNNK